MQGTFVVEPKDLSSTEPYQRDNLAHFFMCGPASMLCVVLFQARASCVQAICSELADKTSHKDWTRA